MRVSIYQTVSIGFVLWLITVLVYSAVATRFFSDFHPSNFPYFTLLAQSFLHRHYDLIQPTPNPFDLSVYKGALYLPWGPLPALIIMPLVWLYGIGISDKLYTAFFGSINVVFVYILLQTVAGLIKKSVRPTFSILLTLFFAFGTVHFSMSVVGKVWFTSQIISLSVFLASLICLFSFLRFKHVLLFLAALGLLLLSVMGRLWYAALIPIFFALFFYTKPPRRNLIQVMIGFVVMSLVFARMYGLYNLRRFGSVWETGYTYQQESEMFLYLRNTYGRFNLHFVPINSWYTLINPMQFISHFPFVKPDPMGNGLFFISPLLLLVGLVGRVWRQEKKLILFCLASIVLYGVQPMLFLGTGFFQFGHRYLLETIPFLLLLLSFIVPSIPKKIFLPLWLFSIIMASLGAVWFTTV